MGRTLPPERQGEVFHRLHPRDVRAVPAPDGPLPGHPVRVVRERRRPLRPGHAGDGATDVDERRHRRRRAAGDPVGHLDGLPAERDGAPTCPPCPTTRPAGSRRSRPGRPWRSSASSATSSTRPTLDDGRACRGPRPDRLLSPPPGTAPVRPLPSAREPVHRGWPRHVAWMSVARDRRVGGRRRLRDASTARRPKRSASACGASIRSSEYRVSVWPERPGRPAVRRAARHLGSGPSSWPTGLILDRERHARGPARATSGPDCSSSTRPDAEAADGRPGPTCRPAPAGREEDALLSPWSSRG